MTALVTGGSSGIGLEYARQLAGRGYDLVIVSNQSDRLDAAAVAIEREFGVAVHPLFMDLSREGCAGRLLAWCDEQDLSIDVLVNNAGIYFMQYLGPGMLDKAQTMLDLHVRTATALCILFGSRMKERGSGRILNMSSVTDRIPAPGIAVYSASKAYLSSFGRSFSYEMRPFGVSVTTVRPAAVDTGLYNLGPGLRRYGRRLGLIVSPERLVRRALRGMFKGRRTVGPGFAGSLLPLLVGLLPASLIDRLGLRWIYR